MAIMKTVWRRFRRAVSSGQTGCASELIVEYCFPERWWAVMMSQPWSVPASVYCVCVWRVENGNHPLLHSILCPAFGNIAGVVVVVLTCHEICYSLEIYFFVRIQLQIVKANLGMLAAADIQGARTGFTTIQANAGVAV